MCLGSSPDTSAADAARKEEQERQARVALGTNAVNDIFRQYNEGFFQRNLANPWLDFSMPQFQDQRRNAFEDLVYGLAGRGLLSSSVGARARNEFNAYADRQEAALQDQARAKVDEGLGRVAEQRNNIISSLNMTGDDAAAINAARSQAQLLAQQPAFSPLGAMFANFTSSFLNNRQNPLAAGGTDGGGSGVSLFNNSSGGTKGSGRVVG